MSQVLSENDRNRELDFELSQSELYRTRGERLLSFLRSFVLSELHSEYLISQIINASEVAEREDYFVYALQDLLSTNVLYRLLLSARWALEHLGTEVESDADYDDDDADNCSEDELMQEPDREMEVNALVRNYVRQSIFNELSIDYSHITPIYNYVIPAAETSRIGIHKQTRRDIYAVHGLTCYLCGIDLVETTADISNKATIDHLWPRILGGDSDFRNLLPACSSCNSKKGDSAIWSSFWFQTCYLEPHPSIDAVNSKLGAGTRIALQFFRSYSEAKRSGMSLKHTMINLGPLNLPHMHDREFPSDFFNLLDYNQKVIL